MKKTQHKNMDHKIKESEPTLRDLLKSLGGDKRTFLDDLTITKKGSFKNIKTLGELGITDQISIVSNSMFFTMLGNSERKTFVCKLLADLFGCDYEMLYENTEYYKNELNKDTVDAKSERADLILKLGDDYICIEMNVREEMNRTLEYSDRVYRKTIKVGSKYVYPQVLAIDLNNFYYTECSDTIVSFWIQSDEHLSYSRKMYIQVYLPLIYQKWYNRGVENLSSFERDLLTMSVTDREVAAQIAKGDTIMEKYMEEAKKVEQYDNYLGQAYDHELSAQLASYEEAYEESKTETIKKMITKHFSLQKISTILEIPYKEVKSVFDDCDEELKKCCDDYLGQAYDHELSAQLASYEDGYEEAHGIAYEEACEKSRTDMIKKMITKHVGLQKISTLLEIPYKDVEKVFESLDEEQKKQYDDCLDRSLNDSFITKELASIIQNMINKKMSKEEISEMTGIPLKQINVIVEDLKD